MLNNLRSLCSRGLMGRFLQDSQEEWRYFVRHPFVKALEQGCLPKENFQRFLIQDYLYLLDYCRVKAVAIYKSYDFASMTYFFEILKGLLEIELPLHRAYCSQWGIEVGQLEQAPRTLELTAYSQFLLNRAMQGDLLDIVVLLLPCLIGYGEVGLTLIASEETRQANHPYASWINLYGGEDYIKLVQNSLEFMEKIAYSYGAEQRYPMLLEEFKRVVTLESAFWDMALQS